MPRKFNYSDYGVLSTLYYITNYLQQPCNVVNNVDPRLYRLCLAWDTGLLGPPALDQMRLHPVSDSEIYPSSPHPRTAL